MSVFNGQKVNSAITNAAFLSRTSNSNTVGKIDLENTDSASGPSVENVQAVLNAARKKWYGVQNIADGGTVTIDDVIGEHIIAIQSTGGEVDFSGTIATGTKNWPDGAKLELHGASDTDFVNVVTSDVDYGVIINGSQYSLKNYYCITLRWREDVLRWVEVGRNI